MKNVTQFAEIANKLWHLSWKHQVRLVFKYIEEEKSYVNVKGVEFEKTPYNILLLKITNVDQICKNILANHCIDRI